MNNIDVGPLCGDIERATITVRTFGASSANDRGEATATSTTTTLEAVVHPAGRKLLQRFDLDSGRATLAVYALVEIPTIGSTRPAQIDYKGRTYEVTAHGDYGDLGGLHLMLAQLVDGAA